ncbi:hypothetical protein [Streptomyces sp. KL116D]|uniref:hypothetical protein n=1 Tax=Streptomyces sp. KL116D TaxID=3045152 RepID=UPI003557B482
MGELLAAATAFPAALFSAAFGAVVAFWGLVVCRVADAEAFDRDVDLRAVGLDGVPVANAVSRVVVVGWLASTVGQLLIERAEAGLGGLLRATLELVLLAASLAIGWGAERALRGVSRHPWPGEPDAPDEPGLAERRPG